MRKNGVHVCVAREKSGRRSIRRYFTPGSAPVITVITVTLIISAPSGQRFSRSASVKGRESERERERDTSCETHKRKCITEIGRAGLSLSRSQPIPRDEFARARARDFSSRRFHCRTRKCPRRGGRFFCPGSALELPCRSPFSLC